MITFGAKFAIAAVMEGWMVELERAERLQIMLSADELLAVENWRFRARMPSRAAAVGECCGAVLLPRVLDCGQRNQNRGIWASLAIMETVRASVTERPAINRHQPKSTCWKLRWSVTPRLRFGKSKSLSCPSTLGAQLTDIASKPCATVQS